MTRTLTASWTPTMCPNPDDHDPRSFRPTFDELEARRMLDELVRILKRTGRYNVIELQKRLAYEGRTFTRRTLHRWIAGDTTPSIDMVELLAIVSGVDLAFLYPDGPDAHDAPIPYVLTDKALQALSKQVGP